MPSSVSSAHSPGWPGPQDSYSAGHHGAAAGANFAVMPPAPPEVVPVPTAGWGGGGGGGGGRGGGGGGDDGWQPQRSVPMGGRGEGTTGEAGQPRAPPRLQAAQGASKAGTGGGGRGASKGRAWMKHFRHNPETKVRIRSDRYARFLVRCIEREQVLHTTHSMECSSISGGRFSTPGPEQPSLSS